jgi:Domain of unknown function (DUF6471)
MEFPMAATNEEWAEKARRFFRAQMSLAGMSYADLAERLAPMGIEETAGSLTAKVNRGVYPAWFLFAAMKAMGREHVRIDDA